MVAWRSEKVRQDRASVQPLVDELGEFFGQQGVEFHFGGSWRRGEPTVGDLDVLFVTESGSLDADLMGEGVDLPDGVDFQRSGKQIAQGSYTLANGQEFHVDFWACTPAQRGAFLMFITGPKDLNVAQRAYAKRNGMSLSQIGVLDSATKQQLDDGTEEGCYRVLGLDWIAPEDRKVFQGGNRVAKHQVEVQNSKGTGSYTVTVDGHRVECTCRGFEFRKACKHSQAIREAEGL